MIRPPDTDRSGGRPLRGDRLPFTRALVLAAEAFVVTLIVGLLVHYVFMVPSVGAHGLFAPSPTLHHPVLSVAGVGVWVVLAALVASRGGGLFGCWLVLFGAFFGWHLVDFVLVESVCCGGSTDTTYELVVNPVLAAIASLARALVAGALGFVVGRVARSLSRRSGEARGA